MKKVKNVTNGTPDKFVFTQLFTPREQILSDIFIDLKRFRNIVKWKWVFLEEKRKHNELENSPLSENVLNKKFSISDNKSDKENYTKTNIITSINLMRKKEGLKNDLALKKNSGYTNRLARSQWIS